MVADLTAWIRTNLECADICTTTGRVLSRHTGYDADLTRAVLQACAQVCKSCADACTQHAGCTSMPDARACRVSAEAYRRCEEASNRVLAAIG